jgi:hypothetical protein
MRIRCAAIVEVDASRWDEDKGSDARNVGNEMKARQRSKFEMRDIFSKSSTFLRQELVGI